MATNTVDRAGKLPRRFMTNQSLGAPIERGTTSLFNHCVRPGPATALAGRFTSKTASQLTNVANGLNEEHSGQSAQRLRMHVHRPKNVIRGIQIFGVSIGYCTSFHEGAPGYCALNSVCVSGPAMSGKCSSCAGATKIRPSPVCTVSNCSFRPTRRTKSPPRS